LQYFASINPVQLQNNQPAPFIVLIILSASLAVIILAVYWPVLDSQAFMFDDEQYLIENKLVQNPGWNSAQRFLTEVLEPSTVRGYYQPISMISLMLDWKMGGRLDNFWQFHLTSLLLHVANTILLLVLLYLVLGQIWPAAFVALLFGLHPTTIESVAWISERKTVLSTFFALLCIISYTLYARQFKWRLYIFILLTYTLALLAKPTVIAMPMLLLILDIWPLKRFNKKAILEKLPLFAIGLAAAIITYISQSRTSLVKTPGQTGIIPILLIFFHNISFYLYNLFRPVELSWFYPFPEPFNLSNPKVLTFFITTCILIPALIISFHWTKSILLGWLFLFIAILPTMGIVGFQPVIAADRHLYFPMIGLILTATYLIGLLWEKIANRRNYFGPIIIIAAVAILGTSEALLTRDYLKYWQDTEGIYKYMLGFAPDETVLHNNLANVLGDKGKHEEAIKHFHKSLQLTPNSPSVHNNLANNLREIGQTSRAIKHYKKALEINPKLAVGHYNLANLLVEKANIKDAIQHYQKAVKYKPDYSQAWRNLASLFTKQGKLQMALDCYNEAIRIIPNDIIAHGKKGLILAQLNKIDDAIKQFAIVLKARPNDKEMHYNIAVLLELTGNTEKAAGHYHKALQIDPDYQKARQRLQLLTIKQKEK